MVPEYNTREEISPQYLVYWHEQYQQNLPDRLWYIIIYIPLSMRYVCRWYYLSKYWYTYGMRITINSYNNWYEVIWYAHKKMLYSHIYPSTYDIHAQMILPKNVLVHIRDENYMMILLPYVSTLYATYVI